MGIDYAAMMLMVPLVLLFWLVHDDGAPTQRDLEMISNAVHDVATRPIDEIGETQRCWMVGDDNFDDDTPNKSVELPLRRW